ncbi:MAG TPA: CBS domain-containing protein [Myxococcales bacterium]
MLCEDVMKREFECISPRNTVEDAAVRMRNQNIGFLPVCDQFRKVLGTLTDRDIAIRVVADGRLPTTWVEDVMTREVVACSPKDELQKAEEIMARMRKSRVMCVDSNGELLGIISLSDIAQHDEGIQAMETFRKISAREARP